MGEEKDENIQISNPKQIKIQFLFSTRAKDGEALVIRIHIDNRRVLFDSILSQLPFVTQLMEGSDNQNKKRKKHKNDKWNVQHNSHGRSAGAVTRIHSSTTTVRKKVSIGKDLLLFILQESFLRNNEKMKNCKFSSHAICFQSSGVELVLGVPLRRWSLKFF